MSESSVVDEQWLSSSADVEEAATLLQKLVAIRSLPGEEQRVQEHVTAWLSEQGLLAELVDVEPGLSNAIARLSNGDGPTLLLNGHVDTAAIDPRWDPARLFGHRDGDRLYGLGAADMKSGVVAAMLATRALDRARDKWRGTVIFSSVTDEEAFSKGAHALLDSGVKADYCIVTEASWPHPSLGAFGKILIRVDVSGKASHASWPDRGVNAAVEAARFVARLSEVPLGNHPNILPSQCVLTIRSGPESYSSIVVPEHAQILINWHTVPGESAEQILERLRSLASQLNSAARFEFAIDPPYYPAWETPVDAPITLAFSRTFEQELGYAPEFHYTGYGDMNLFSAEAGIPTIMFGPLGANYHEADEWVDLPSIAATIRILLRFACDLLPIQ